MQLQTILNAVEKQRSFVYRKVRLAREGNRPQALEVDLVPRANGHPICSRCRRPGPGYDTLPMRRFEFVPLWGLLVFFCYAPRRVDCTRCGVRVEALPWATGKHQLTTTYAWFLATWAKRLSWSEVARVFRTSWDTVFRAVALAVAWGRAHVDLSGITAIGVDEILWQRGHRYLTVVYQINDHRKRLLWVGLERRVRTLLEFFRWFGPEWEWQDENDPLWHSENDPPGLMGSRGGGGPPGVLLLPEQFRFGGVVWVHPTPRSLHLRVPRGLRSMSDPSRTAGRPFSRFHLCLWSSPSARAPLGALQPV